jgi:NADH-quinone oxidoreductase subunit J
MLLITTSAIITASLFLIVSTNPLHSIIALICAFINSSIFLLAFEISDFIAFTYLIIYVGAMCFIFICHNVAQHKGY